MMKPILILHTSWMTKYRGSKNDTPTGKFSCEARHEVYNFKPNGRWCYGYGPAETINLRRLGGKCGDTKLDNVLVIWTATRPGGGRFIVGWYDDATVYRNQQVQPKSRATSEFIGDLYFNVRAQKDACHLQSVDDRVFPVPTMTKGYPGTSPAFFPEESPSKAWVVKIRNYVNTGHVQTKPAKRNDVAGKPVDVKFKKKVEEGAIDMVFNSYESHGYNVISREKDNIGWDLEARRGGLSLKLEVKGLSGNVPQVEVTPNEYKAMSSKEYRQSYRLCIVTQAHKPKSANLRIFGYNNCIKAWVSENEEEKLEVTERKAAHIKVATLDS